MADRIPYRLPLLDWTGVLSLAVTYELYPCIILGEDTQNAHKGWFKAHFYNMPGVGGQTVPQGAARYTQTGPYGRSRPS
jgi:hypothetical protein